MTDERKIPVHDRRGVRGQGPATGHGTAEEPGDSGGRLAEEAAASADASAAPQSAEAEGTPGPAGRPEHDYLDDLRRVQAEFENYRKRMMKQQAEVSARATATLVRRLLPVLDNFERAISHGEGGEGVALVFKELRAALEAEGVEEIPAEDVPFDPHIHDAVESHEDDAVEEPMSQRVYRRGYKLGGHVIRPAMVVVARPAEPAAQGEGAGETVGERDEPTEAEG